MSIGRSWCIVLCSLWSQSLANFKVLSPIISNMSESQYQWAFQRIQRYIVEGDCYQVNLAQRFSAQG